MKLKAKHLRERPRSRQKQPVRKDVMQKEGKTWDKIQEELQIGRDRWTDLIARLPTYRENIKGKGRRNC